MTVSEAVDAVEGQSGVPVRVLEPLSGGAIGGWVVLFGGRRAVLKMFQSPGEQASARCGHAVVRELRADGYPAPRYLALPIG